MDYRVEPVPFDSRPNAAFQTALKERVRAYLRTQPNGSKATPYMWFKVWLFVGAYWSTWASLVLVPHSIPVTLGVIVLHACACMAIAYNVSHDAVHDALSHRKWVNEAFFYLTFNPLGPTANMFRLRHKIMHHACVNIPGLDYNIEAAGILRFAPSQPWKPYHRWQHLYAPFAYMLFTIHWVFIKDFQIMGQKDVGNVRDIRHPWWRPLEIVAWKIFYVCSMLALPTLVLPWAWWQVLLGFLLFQAFVSMQFVLTFVGSHLNERMVFVDYVEGKPIPHSFVEHQLRTSLDFHPTDPFVSFFFGGFNAHVAHHIYPGVCSVHYPAITRVIQATCKEYGMPYFEMPLKDLYFAHFRYLRDLGRDRESPYRNYQLEAA